MKVGDMVWYWPLMADAPRCSAVLLTYDSDEWADLEEKPPRPSWHVLMDGRAVWIRERDLRKMS